MVWITSRLSQEIFNLVEIQWRHYRWILQRLEVCVQFNLSIFWYYLFIIFLQLILLTLDLHLFLFRGLLLLVGWRSWLLLVGRVVLLLLERQ